MVRVRKEKGHASARGPRNGVSKAMRELGGTQADLDLLKDVDENAAATTGQPALDPKLVADVSNFLTDLKGKGKEKPKQKEQGKEKGKGKDKAKASAPAPVPEKATKPKPSEKSAVKEKKKAHTAAAAAAPAPSPPKKPNKTEPLAAATAAEPSVSTKLPTKISFNPKSHFVFPPTSQWHAALPDLPPTQPTTTIATQAQVATLFDKASQLHSADVAAFQSSSAGHPSSSSSSSSAEAQFLFKIIQSGTLSDRLSALTLLVQSSPVHNVRALETLKGMAERGKGKGGREESLKALRAFVDWWVGGGVPGRKLKYFRDQPLLHKDLTDSHLLVWYFEDWLKKHFFSILQILETLSLDPLPYIRTQAVNLIYTLLKDKPEQEQNLLRLLVNKLGDGDKALCSKASHQVLKLLQVHPSMKAVVVQEIIALVLKPSASASASTTSGVAAGPSQKQNSHIRFGDPSDSKSKPKKEDKKPSNAHARYYATVTFNQIILTPTPADREVSLKLLDIYFEMFKELLGDGNIEDDDVAPGAGKEQGGEDGEAGEGEVKTDKKGRVMDKGGAKGKGKGKQKGKGKAKGRNEVKGAAGFTEVEDSNSKLISAILTGVNRALPFARIDAGSAGINNHIDSLFLITHKSTFNISLQALMLIQQICASLSTSSPSSSSSSTAASTAAAVQSITDRYYRTLYASLHDPRLASSSKQAMYLNLLYKSIKADPQTSSKTKVADDVAPHDRVKALVRRFVQVLVSGGGGATEFVAGGLYLLGELFGSTPGLRGMIDDAPPSVSGSGSIGSKSDTSTAYDPRKRDPQFAHASTSPLFELTTLVNHYHPSVSLHARQLLAGQPLTATADLSQNTLGHFLDRFVYKNPKKVRVAEANEEDGVGSGVGVVGKGGSAMQPAATGVDGVKLIRGEVRDEGGLMNDKAFAKRKRESVPVDQVFFHEYFRRKEERERVGRRKKKGGEDEEGVSESEGGEDSDGESDEEEEEEVVEKGKADVDSWDEGDSDLEEAEIWKVMKATMPKDDGDSDLMEDSADESEDMDEDEDEDEAVNFDDDSELAPSGDESDGGLSLVEASDNEDLVSLDGDVPVGLMEYDGSDAGADSDDGDPGILVADESEEWGGIGGSTNSKKRKQDESKSGRRKKLRSLPTFASYEDYAKLIEDGPEDDI